MQRSKREHFSNFFATLAPKPAVLLDIASLLLVSLFLRSTMSYLILAPREGFEPPTTRLLLDLVELHHSIY
jgi:hypothetical protein